ncbi:MAG: TIGR01777 family protein [Actinomyces sp.]|nr:MAG: TIGR01777 family protein [Actinomyces sp.]
MDGRARVAVTGATGLIGRALVESLTAEGHAVTRILRRPPDPGADPDGTDHVLWDPATGHIDAAGLEGVDAVVHLAGEPIASHRWTDEQKARIRDSRVAGTRLLARTLARLDQPPRVLVSGSAIGVYGDRGDDPIDETAPPGDDFLAQVCVEWEGATEEAADAGIRVAHARTGIVLSGRGGALARMLPLFRLGLGGRLGSGRQWWSWISLTDEVAALRWLVDHDVAGPVNLTAPRPVTNAEFTRTLARVLRRPALVPAPRFALGLVLGRELADALLFTSARVLPVRLAESGFSFAHDDLATALAAELGRPVPT